MAMIEMVYVSAAEYRRLQADSAFLQRLHDAGVDNWDGYAEACRDDDDGDNNEGNQ